LSGWPAAIALALDWGNRNRHQTIGAVRRARCSAVV